jgi:uncharacterized membrane protein YccC
MPAWPAPSAVRAGLRRYLGDLRASRAFVAEEVTDPGWLNLGQFRWHNIAPGPAARTAFGVLVPLILGIATGHDEYGTFAALGALPAGFVSFRGVTRTRLVLVALTALGMAISTFVGAATAGGAPWMLVPAIIVFAYIAGVCAALGPSAIAVSLQWPTAVLIASAIPLGPGPSLIRAGLVLAGGLWQGVLVVTTWAFSRGSSERTAMAASYESLSQYAADLVHGFIGPPAAETLPGTEALRDPNPLLRNSARQHLVDLMEEAERIRTSLTALAATEGGPDTARWKLLAASSAALAEIAEALSSRPAQRAAHLDNARRDVAEDVQTPGASWNWLAAALDGQLRSAARITARLNDAEPGRPGRPPRPTLRLPARDLLVTLRASLSTSSEVGRHAIRLAVVAGVAEVIAQAGGLPHGYWAALTVLIVLRPDYGSTLQRGLQRAGGTLVGAGLGVATALLGNLSSTALLIGMGVSLFAAFAVFTVNYLFYAVFLTDFVVVLLAIAGLPADVTAVDRLIGTGVGTALAIAAYILWPTWERTSASDKFARMILAQGRFADLILRAYSRPAGEAARQARSLKLAARRNRIDAEASADRLADEPDRPPVTRDFARALVSVGHRMALSTLALEAAVGGHHTALSTPDAEQPAAVPVAAPAGAGSPAAAASSAAVGSVTVSPASADPVAAGPGAPGPGSDESGSDPSPRTAEPDPGQAQLDQFADLVRQATTQLADALHRLGPPGPLPPLREIQARLPSGGDWSALSMATDSLVDSLNTTADILRRYLATPATPAPASHRPGPD